jgi:TonB family protein
MFEILLKKGCVIRSQNVFQVVGGIIGKTSASLLPGAILVILLFCVSAAEVFGQPGRRTAGRTTADPGSQLFAEALKMVQQDDYNSVVNGIKKAVQACAAFEAAGNLKSEGDCWMLVGRGKERLGEQSPKNEYEVALQLYRKAGDNKGFAAALNNLGGIYRNQNESKKALEHYTQALPLMRQTNHRTGEAATLNGMGEVYLGNLHQFETAIDYFTQAHKIWQSLKDRSNSTRVLVNIGDAYKELKNNTKAEAFYNLALTEARTAGDKWNEARVLNNIGSMYSDLNERNKALDYYTRANAVYQSAFSQVHPQMTVNIAEIHYKLNAPEQAIRFLNQALPVAQAIKDYRAESYTYGLMGEIYKDAGEYQKALTSLQTALNIARTAKERRVEGEIFRIYGDTYMLMKNYQTALDYFRQAQMIARETKFEASEADALRGMGMVYFYQKDFERAEKSLEDAVRIGESSNSADVLVKILTDLGTLLFQGGEREKAQSAWQTGLDVARQTNYKLGEAKILAAMGGGGGRRGVSNFDSNSNQTGNYSGNTNLSDDNYVSGGSPIKSSGKTISGGILNGKATSLPLPSYPAAARAVKASGAVNVQVTIDEQGNVISASAVSGHPLLRQAAEQAARAAIFQPTMLSGELVKVTGVIVYNFVP